MNKIYKVVWSKVKHCYVVTSELAKRNGKGNGARSLRMAAVSMGVAAALLGGVGATVAEAATTITGTVEKGGVSKSITEANFYIDGYQRDWGAANEAFEGTTGSSLLNPATGYTTVITAANWRLFRNANLPEGTVSGNTLTLKGDSISISQSVVGGEIYGDSSKSEGVKGTVTDNHIIIESGTYKGTVYGGSLQGGYGATVDGDVTLNTVTINGGTVGAVYGGYGPNKTNSNVVTVSSGTIGSSAEQDAVVGANNYGFGNDPIATLNKVTVNGDAKVSGSVIGARDGYGTAVITDNTVTIDGSAVVSGNIAGGYGWDKDNTKNKVYIKSGSVTGDVYGATQYSNYNNNYTGNADSNEVHISGGKVTGNVYGGSLEGKVTGDVKDNKVEITGGEVTKEVHGGLSSSANASNIDHNSVSISNDAIVGNNVYGGKIDWDKSGTVTNNSVTMSGGTVGGLYGGYSRQAHGTGAVSGNTVEMKGGKLSGYGYIVGGYSTENYTTDNPTKVDVINNVVKITGDVDFKTSVVGGWAQGSGLVQNNRVEFSANNVDHDGEGEFSASVKGGHGGSGGATDNKVVFSKGAVNSVIGGLASKEVQRNSVEMSGGTVYGEITGGSGGSGTVDNNEVNISNGTVGKSASADSKTEVSGGYSSLGAVGFPSYPTMSASGIVSQNAVTISNGTYFGELGIRGGYMGASASAIAEDTTATVTGTIDSNAVTVSGGTYSGKVNIYGGYGNAIARGSGTATATVAVTNNTATISGGTFSENVNVYGGYGGSSTEGDGTLTASVTVENNKVIFSGSKVTGNVYGGYNDSGNVTGDANSNKVEMTGGTVTGDVMGGYSETGNAKSNTVTVSGNAVTGSVYGGLVYVSGDVTGNTVTISDGTVKSVFGGATPAGLAENNTVNISGGTVNMGVCGGFSSNNKVTGNKVTISGGTINADGETPGVYGGYIYASIAEASKNSVTITKGTVNCNVYGGASDAGSANNNSVTVTGGSVGAIYGGSGGTKNAGGSSNNNTVTIGGGTVGGNVYGGYNEKGVATINNTVNLTGSTTGLENAEVYGGNLATYTGNELHVGGTKDGSVTSVWTGSSNNTVKKVANFETIALHSIAWNKDVAAMEATTVENVGTLDIKDLQFDKTPPSDESMALLKSESVLGAGGVNIGIAYKDGSTEKTATSADLVTGVTFDSGELVDTAVNGVTLAGTQGKKVSLEDEGKTILYSFSATVSGITFGTFDIAAGARDLTGSTFATPNTVDANGLIFADTNKAIAKDASITLVSNATGMATTVANNTGKTIAIKDYEDAQKIKYSATASGDVSSDGTAVKYTVSSVALDSVDLAGWTGTASDVQSETTGWTVKSGASITTGDLANAGLDTMNPGDVKTILTADTTADFSVASITGNKAWQDGGDITDTDISGVTVAGSTTGGGVKADNTNKNVLIYQKDKKTITGITLGSVAFTKGGTVRSFDNSYDLTGAGITATGFGISNAGTATMNTGDEMVVVDATNAIGETKLQEFTKTEKPIAFSDAIDGTVVTFAGTRADSLEQNAAKTQIIYKVGDKNVATATLNGTVEWGSAGYSNDSSQYKISNATKIDATNLKVTGTTTEALTVGSGMTLLSSAGLEDSNTVVQPADAGTVTVNFTDTKGVAYVASATGEVKAQSGSVDYKVTGVTANTIKLDGWNGTGSVMSQEGIGDWKVNSGASITTGDLANAGLDTMNPGDVKTILTADTTADFSIATITGNKAWQDGGDITDTDTSGVTVAGTTTGGGVKADGTNKNVLVYQKDARTITGITLGSVAFTKDSTVRSFDNSYNLAGADFTTTGFSISNAATATMNTGDTMVVVDAVNAIKGAGEATRTLKDFAKQNAGAAIAFTDQIEGKALTLSGTHQDTLEQNEDKNQILYKVGDKNVTAATFTGEVAWNDSEAYYTNDASKYKIAATNVDATNLKVTGTSTKALKNGDAMTLLSAEGMTATLAKDQSDANKTASKITVNYSDAASGIGFGAEAAGEVKVASGAVNYEVTGVTLNSVDLGSWNGTASDLTTGDTSTWTAADKSVAVNNADAVTVVPTVTQAILTAGSGMFADVNVEKEVAFDPVVQNGVTLSGTQTNVIKTTQTNVANDTITYEIGKKDVKSIDIDTVEWGGTALDGSGTDYNYAGASVDHSKFGISNPDKVEADTSMTLLQANATLAEMAEETKKASFVYSPVSGVRIDGDITGTMSRSGNNVVFTATENKASQLTFTDVEWKDTLMTRPANIVFDGAKVVTTDIKFTNIDSQVADQSMTLVQNFDGTPSAIEGDHYMVGSGRMGEGAAEMSGKDLIFRAKTGTAPTEATHETVMAMEAGTAVVAAGREYVESAVEGLGLVSNMAPDGTSTFASMGGGVGRYQTGSHVDTHTWSAVVAVGSKKELKKGDLEWGVFAEYGRGNYTLHDDNGGRGDGDTHYAGGGLLAKWTNKHNVYAEASFRMGRMSDTAKNMLTDRLGNSYGYDIDANYFGAHVGLGKIIKVKNNRDLDVYGKFFYTRRNGVNFDAGGNHYSLDSVASELLRIGARYGSNDRKWNWYGGLAYEYEFGGESKGTVDGLAIRSASIKGSSVRGEIGMRLEATKTNPWKADISIYGYGGKHRGFGGNISIAYMF